MPVPTFEDIRLAHDRIRHHVHHTGVLTSSALNEMSLASLYFKCENFQKTGAFKFRGAMNAILSLSDDEARRGVATHSSGNHGAALALAARKRGISCTAVVPRNALRSKIEAMQAYGATVIFCEPDLKSREDGLKAVTDRTGAVFIHPYDNFYVICGQGTAAKELLEEVPGLDLLFVPVGGGGLLSGSLIAAKSLSPSLAVYGCEPAMADDACRSLKAGKIIPSVNPATMADGLLTSLSPLTFEIIRNHVKEILTVSEEEIVAAMKLVWQRMKIIVEASSAVALAAVMANKGLIRNKRAGIILTGGNVNLSNLPFG